MSQSGGWRRLLLRLILGLLPPLSAWGAGFAPHPQTACALRELGYRTDESGNLVRIDRPAGLITRIGLENAGLRYDEDGLLIRASGAWLGVEELRAVIESLPVEVSPAPPEFDMHPALAAYLRENGFSFNRRGDLRHKRSGRLVTRKQLNDFSIEYSSDGGIPVFTMPKHAGRAASLEWFGRTLRGIMEYDKVSALDSQKVGKSLRSWRVPETFDGAHLLNPDGTATYFGKMFYSGIQDRAKPKTARARLSRLSGEKLSKAIESFKRAHSLAFSDEKIPFLVHDEIKTGFAALRDKDRPAGDAPLNFAVKGTLSAARLRQRSEDAALAEADPAERAKLLGTIKELNELERQRFHKEMDIKDVPDPILGEDKSSAPRHDALPILLASLPEVLGGPLSEAQKEALIKSFPMGESVWRMRADKIWEEGYTGKGVSVAVIDSGAARNPELRDAVAAQKEFVNRAPVPLPGTADLHATHVSGTIHALAPDAQIHSYDVFEEAGANDERIIRAIDAAVADGHKIINMSLGGPGSPADDVVRRVEKYAREGVVFFISAGNSGNEHGVGAPSIAEGAITVGALDVNGKMAPFSSYGGVYDPDRLAYRFKKIYMAPGTNIVSTSGLDDSDENFASLDGTSMAAPHGAGAGALLMGKIMASHADLNPVRMSGKLKAALDAASKPMDRNGMPGDLSEHQPVAVMDAWSAFLKL